MTVRIDETRIRNLIEDKKAKRVVLNAPDGLLSKTRELVAKLEEKHPGLQSIVISDSTYGSCDTVDLDALRLGADLAFHIGHNITLPSYGKITYPIDAYDDVKFDIVIEKASQELLKRNLRKIALVTFAQHLNELNSAKEHFERAGLEALIGKGLGQLHDGQIFGCEFYPAFNLKDKVDAMILLGQSMFHSLGLALSTGKPTFMLDPYSEQVVNMQELADERLKRAILSIYRARDAENFGIIIGLKEGQIMTEQSINFKERLEALGKKVQLFAMREITSDRLNALSGIEAFIQTGCPRIAVDGYTFSKPVLSVPQADALINLLAGKEIESTLLVRKHWL